MLFPPWPTFVVASYIRLATNVRLFWLHIVGRCLSHVLPTIAELSVMPCFCILLTDARRW